MSSSAPAIHCNRQARLDQRKRGETRGLRAQNPRAEMDEVSARCPQLVSLLARPASFRTDRDRHWRTEGSLQGGEALGRFVIVEGQQSGMRVGLQRGC